MQRVGRGGLNYPQNTYTVVSLYISRDLHVIYDGTGNTKILATINTT